MPHHWLLVVVRIVAWSIALCAFLAVLIGYDSLPAELPVTRWTSAPKIPLLALRVPLINLLTLGLIEVLWRGMRQVSRFSRGAAVAGVLLLTAAAKAAIEAVGILRLPDSASWSLLPLAALLLIGLAMAAMLSADFLRDRRWGELQLSRRETAVACVLIAGILALNLPVFAI